MGRIPITLRRHLPWLLLGTLLALLAACSSTASAANTPPLEGCGPLALDAETAALNLTRGLQGRYLSVNFTLCDLDETAANLTFAIYAQPAAPWLAERNDSGGLQLSLASPTNAMVGTNFLSVSVCDSSHACTAVLFHLFIDNANDSPTLSDVPQQLALQDESFRGPPITAVDPDLAVANRLNSGRDAVSFSLQCPIGTIVTIDNGTVYPGFGETHAQILLAATNDEVGEWDCQVTATDLAGANASANVRIVVANIDDWPTLVRVEIVENATGEQHNITRDGERVGFAGASLLAYRAIFDDPDLHRTKAPGGHVVDPNETLVCTIGDTYEVTPILPRPAELPRATIDPASCQGELRVDWIAAGTITLRIKATESSHYGREVPFEVDITNDVTCNPQIFIFAPRGAFRLAATQRLDLRGSATCLNGSVVEMRYDWTVAIVGGRNYTATGASTSVTLWNDLVHDAPVTVILSVTANGGEHLTQTHSMLVHGTITGNPNSRPLSLRPSGAPVNLPGSLSVAFAANVEGGLAPYSLYWDFGDGTSSQEGMPIHAYGAEGNYTVTVTVTDATGFAATHVFQVQVVEQRGNTGAVWTIFISLALVAGITLAGLVALLWKGGDKRG